MRTKLCARNVSHLNILQRTTLKIIPASKQRYETSGDYWVDKHGRIQICEHRGPPSDGVVTRPLRSRGHSKRNNLRAARDRETSRVLRRRAGAAGLGIRGGAPCSIS